MRWSANSFSIAQWNAQEGGFLNTIDCVDILLAQNTPVRISCGAVVLIAGCKSSLQCVARNCNWKTALKQTSSRSSLTLFSFCMYVEFRHPHRHLEISHVEKRTLRLCTASWLPTASEMSDSSSAQSNDACLPSFDLFNGKSYPEALKLSFMSPSLLEQFVFDFHSVWLKVQITTDQ